MFMFKASKERRKYSLQDERQQQADASRNLFGALLQPIDTTVVNAARSVRPCDAVR
jgi:hypothetical protein